MAWLSENEVYVGRDFGGREVEITPDLVQHFIEAVGDRNPWYSESSPFGGPVAPAFLLCQEVYRSLGWYLSAYGNLHVKQEWELFQRLCDPASPDFILDVPGYYAFFTETLFYGMVPA